MLRQRVITAIFLIAVILAILFYFPPSLFCILTALIGLAGAWEWTNLMELKSTSSQLLYLVIMLLIFFNTLFVPVTLIFLIAFVWWIIATILIVLYPKFSDQWGRGSIWRGLMGILVLMPSWVAINYIRNQNDGINALIFLFVLIWGADSIAYFVGKKWGKNKLAPLVSPGKSVQGAIGALTFAILIVWIVLFANQISWSGWSWATMLSLTTVLFSIVGDLFESMLKRRVNLKDSGRLLPGHGGILDRIDSLTAAAPIFAFGALLLGKYL